MKRLYVPKENSYGYWKHKLDLNGVEYRRTCQRVYPRPWDLSL